MTNEEHNRYIAWAFLANGLFQVLILLFMLVFLAAFFFGAPPSDGFADAFFVGIFGFVLVINLVLLSPNFVAAYALLKRKPWARIAGIVAAALSAMNVPLGTLAAVYSLWFFCGDQWKSVYPEVAAAGQAELPPPHAAQQAKWEAHARDEEGAWVYRTPPPPDWR